MNKLEHDLFFPRDRRLDPEHRDSTRNTTVQLLNGELFDVFQPDAQRIDLDSLATALSHINRFGGHTFWPYTDAQHAVHVSEHCHPGWADAGLHHDDPEGLGLGDMCSPIKHHPDMFTYCTLEDGVMAAVRERFNLPRVWHSSIKIADKRMCHTEKRDLQHHSVDWPNYLPYPEIIVPWSPSYAKQRYLQRHEETEWLNLLSAEEREREGKGYDAFN